MWMSTTPKELLGNAYEGWPGERWLDIHKIDTLGPIMENRFQIAASKGCDGVDPDNMDSFENNTGFYLSYTDQLSYNLWLSQTAHSNELDI